MTDASLTPRHEPDAMVAAAESRVAAEVQAAMVIARRFPRDETAAFARAMAACKRRGLAAAAEYAYPRGGQTVTGPSIRLAEALAQTWGNLDFGVVEVEQRRGESTVLSYCWDLETNVRQTKVFTVAHSRYTRQKGVVSLTDPRDIYEMTANQAARRLRACILGVIPGDVVEAAVGQCRKTLSEADGGVPLKDRVRQMAAAFDGLGVSVAMLEARLGHKLAATSEAELVNLRAIFRSLTDNMSAVAQWFGEAPAKEEPKKPEPMSRKNVREDAKAPAKRKSPPPRPKEGDRWLRTEGPEEALLVFRGGSWVELGEPLEGEEPQIDDDLGLDDPPQEAQETAQEAAQDEAPQDTAEEPNAQEAPREAAPPPKLTGAMLGRIHMAFRKLKVADADRLAFLGRVYDVPSSKELEFDQARDLIDALEEGLASDPVGCVQWIEESGKDPG
jgi:hypothetical protein